MKLRAAAPGCPKQGPTLPVVMYKNLEVSNTDIALHTSWLCLPWVIKPLRSPQADLLHSKRWWIVTLQTAIGTHRGRHPRRRSCRVLWPLLQSVLGHANFFVCACVATLPSFAAAALLKIDPEFGRRDRHRAGSIIAR